MPKFEYPMFYIKHVGGQFSIEHRLSHTFIESVKEEKQLAERIKYWVEMDERKFWEYLLDKRFVRVPKRQEGFRMSKDKSENADNEKWYNDAWSIYTDLFYTRNPKLYVEVTDYPYEVINAIRRDRFTEDKLEEERKRYEREEAEERFKEEQKQLKKKDKVVLDESGKLGSTNSLMRLKKKAKKGIKKLKIKTKSEKVFEIEDSLDPFA
jgi:hypothetical protein